MERKEGRERAQPSISHCHPIAESREDAMSLLRPIWLVEDVELKLAALETIHLANRVASKRRVCTLDMVEVPQRDPRDQARFLRRLGFGTPIGVIFKDSVASADLVSMLRSITVNASILPFAKRAASSKVLKV